MICLEHADDATRVEATLAERFAAYGLTLHPKKTRSFSFRPPKEGGDAGGPTFDFLGFTLHWQRTLGGGAWRVTARTRGVRLRRAIKSADDWCRRHRHRPVEEQHRMLSLKLIGHYNYFAVNGNSAAISTVRRMVERAWRRWLDRRSQRSRMGWKRFGELLRRHPLPPAKIRVQIWSNP